MEVIEPRSLKRDINVTPLVDVMLVMLIIFMLVTPLLQKGVSVSLPKARNVHAVSENERQVLVIVLRQDGQLFLGTEPTDRVHVAQALRMRHDGNPALQLQIKADRDVRFGEIRPLVRACREAGFENAALVAEEILEDGKAVGIPAGG